ncbi:MAG TPA: hypothetical protein VFR67_26960 [Pilimelia sp.]|nr:hypothetical protein [Pilimelia sp.]
MDYAQVHALTTSTIRGMYDRIPAQYHNGFEVAFGAGELRQAVDMLIGGLKRFHTPITPAERDNLARVLRHLEEPESRLAGINVGAAPSD